MDKQCQTKYPIVFVHGMGARDRKIFNYWGRIPKAVEKCGGKVYFGNQDSNGSLRSNAETVKKSIEAVLKETNCQKVNIIAHSKGGLEARYVISSMGMEGKVASLTTVSTPHNGSLTMDKIMKLPKVLMRFGCGIADLWFGILGDKKPDTYSCLVQFTTAAAKKFNEENPDSDKVYYQSYGFYMKKWYSDLFMAFPHAVVKFFEGENDGLLTPKAVEWTNFRGIGTGAGRSGVSHCHQVDMYRFPLKIEMNGKVMDITEVYKDIVCGLKDMGF